MATKRRLKGEELKIPFFAPTRLPLKIVSALQPANQPTSVSTPIHTIRTQPAEAVDRGLHARGRHLNRRHAARLPSLFFAGLSPKRRLIKI